MKSISLIVLLIFFSYLPLILLIQSLVKNSKSLRWIRYLFYLPSKLTFTLNGFASFSGECVIVHKSLNKSLA